MEHHIPTRSLSDSRSHYIHAAMYLSGRSDYSGSEYAAIVLRAKQLYLAHQRPGCLHTWDYVLDATEWLGHTTSDIDTRHMAAIALCYQNLFCLATPDVTLQKQWAAEAWQKDAAVLGDFPVGLIKEVAAALQYVRIRRHQDFANRTLSAIIADAEAAALSLPSHMFHGYLSRLCVERGFDLTEFSTFCQVYAGEVSRTYQCATNPGGYETVYQTPWGQKFEEAAQTNLAGLMKNFLVPAEEAHA